MNVNDFKPEDLDDEFAAYNDAVEFAELLEASSFGDAEAAEARWVGANRLVATDAKAAGSDLGFDGSQPTSQSLMRHVADHFDKNNRSSLAVIWNLTSFVSVKTETPETRTANPPPSSSTARTNDYPESFVSHTSPHCACESCSGLDFGSPLRRDLQSGYRMPVEGRTRPRSRTTQEDGGVAGYSPALPAEGWDTEAQLAWWRARSRVSLPTREAEQDSPSSGFKTTVGLAIAAAAMIGVTTVAAANLGSAPVPEISPTAQSSSSRDVQNVPGLASLTSTSQTGPPLPGGRLVEDGTLTAAWATGTFGIGIRPMPEYGRVLAVQAGVIIGTEPVEGLETITVKHLDGTLTIYGNIDERSVSVGDKVSMGQLIGTTSGDLLFAVEDATGIDIDALTWLRDRGVEPPPA